MKKIFYILLFFALFSCTKPEDDPSGREVPAEEKEDPSKKEDPQPDPDPISSTYTVLDESEKSSGELFAPAVKFMQQFGVPEWALLLDGSEVYGTKSHISDGLFKVVRVIYKTKDESDRDVDASALIIYPASDSIGKVMLINHGTNAGDLMVPTQYTSVEAVLAATGAMCILPDYVGLGSSTDHGELYLNAKVGGRTSVDALLTLLSYAKDRSVALSATFDTYIIGYSQGGAVSLAALKEIQSLSTEVQDAIRLKKVICGDGPYDLRSTFESYLDRDEAGLNLGMGAVVPRVINGMFNSYPDVLGKYNYEDFFTKQALSTGVPQAVRSNDSNLSDMLLKLSGARLSEIIDFDYLSSHKDAYDALVDALDRQNLCTGWTPAYPLQFFHCNPDGVVPYVNLEKAREGLSSPFLLEPVTLKYTLIFDPTLQHLSGMAVMICNLLGGRYLD